MRNLYIFLLLIMGVGVFGQKTKSLTPPCATDEVYQELVKKDPSLSRRMDEMNEQIRNFANEFKKSSNNKTTQTNFTIPVIVYVVHSNQSLGTGSNISDNQVQTQLDALNNYYSGTGLNFCFATKAGSQTLIQAAGNSSTASSTTPGIIHINNATIANHQTTANSQQALVAGTSGNYILNQNRYLRIWVVESINDSTTSGIQGYSYFPNTSTILDGIVMSYTVFGDISNTSCNCNLTANYQEGKVLVHEVGHYLGLRHTFQGGCHDTSGINSQIFGDLVADTPPVQIANFGCPSNVDSCTDDTQVDDVGNYMDYTYDACKNHFTTGQNERMLFHLMNYRSNLYTTDNLIFTGVCGSSNLVSSSFTGSLSNTGNSYIYNICAGSTMYFKPTTPSTSYPSGTISYLWDFGNGVTSTLENPSTVYNLSSNTFYTVTLTVTSSGNSSTSSRNIYVNNCSPIINNESTWYFSQQNILKFNTGVPRTNGIISFPGIGDAVGTDSADNTFKSINIQNDNSGNVLLFTDGKDIYNGTNPAIRINNTRLIGNGSLGQETLILKSPVNNNDYYIIHNLSKGSGGSNFFNVLTHVGIRYSIVNINGGVPTMSNSVNTPIVPTSNQTGFRTSSHDGAFFGTNSVQAVEKNNGGYWIIAVIYRIDGTACIGVFDFAIDGSIVLKNTYLLPSYITPVFYNTMSIIDPKEYTFLSISPNGDKIIYNTNFLKPLIFDFDKFEGVITQTTEFDNIFFNGYGYAFSPNSKLIYSSQGQIDIDTPLIMNNPTSERINYMNSYAYGPDDKIYFLTGGNANGKIGVIHNPNIKVTNSNPNAFLSQQDILKTEFVNYGNKFLPNFVHTKKSTAYDVNQISAYKVGCNAYKFFPDVNVNTATPSFIWNFGDPNSGSTNTSTLNTPIHEFSASGTYTVTVSLSGSSTPLATTQVTITTFTPPAIQGTSEVCFSNGTATTFNSVALQNGQTVVWSILSGTGTILQNNQTEVQITWTQLGTISALITDPSGCSGTVTKTITVQPNITPTFSGIPSSICSGSTAPVLLNTSDNGITGSWSPSTVSNTNSGSYVFTANSNYCASSVTIPIEVLPANDPSCNSNPCLPNLTLSTIENNSTIIYKRANWIEANASYVVDVNKNVTMKAGDYIVFNTDSHLKAGSEVTALIEVCTPTSKNSNIETIEKVILEEAILNESILLFPNPTSDRLTIASDNVTMNSVIITAMDGKIIYTNNSVNNSKLELNTSSFQAGVYIVNITTKNGTGFIKKLVKN